MGKNENSSFSKTIAIYELNVGRCVKLYDLMNYKSINGQDRSSTFAKGQSVFKLKSFSFQTQSSYLESNTMCKISGAQF